MCQLLPGHRLPRLTSRHCRHVWVRLATKRHTPTTCVTKFLKRERLTNVDGGLGRRSVTGKRRSRTSDVAARRQDSRTSRSRPTPKNLRRVRPKKSKIFPSFEVRNSGRCPGKSSRRFRSKSGETFRKKVRDGRRFVEPSQIPNASLYREDKVARTFPRLILS